jgi:hypothetical protein
LDLDKTGDNIALSVSYWSRLECISEHLISGKAALVNDHLGLGIATILRTRAISGRLIGKVSEVAVPFCTLEHGSEDSTTSGRVGVVRVRFSLFCFVVTNAFRLFRSFKQDRKQHSGFC